MKTLFVFCTDINTMNIFEKYSNEGLFMEDEEFKGDLNFSEREDVINFLKDIEDAPGNLDYDEDELDDIMEYFDAYL
ncbi:hypothetical protein N9651_01300 [Flavobacteriales bacterium]|nr:hypothetical protein [Flavobacteriales bacterium]